MSDYPEHDKQREVAEISQEIGEFLDFGLPRMGLQLYQKITRSCEAAHKYCSASAWHTTEELATIVDPDSRGPEGRVQIMEWVPTHRSIQSVLAEYFGIDQKKIDAEKDAMLRAMRKANAMSVCDDMAHDAGARGDEARQMAAQIEQEERRRYEEGQELEREADECLRMAKDLSVLLDSRYAAALTWGKYLHDQIPESAVARHEMVDITVSWAQSLSGAQREVLALLNRAPDLAAISEEFLSKGPEAF